MNPIRDHALRYEGRRWTYSGPRNGPGVGGCECGAKSPVLPTTAARKRWHREHKQAVLDKPSDPKVVCDACWNRRGGGGAPPADCPECHGTGMVDR